MSKHDPPDVGVRRPALTPGGGLRTDEHPAGPDVPSPPHRSARRNQRSIVPTAAGLFCMVIGLIDIISVIVPAWHERLRRMHATVVPGTAVVITGLLLLML